VSEQGGKSSAKPWQRYYMDKYEKCANCGKLLYGEGFTTSLSSVLFRFCSDWCKEWFVSRRDERAAGVGVPAKPSPA
jgi:N-methylhydantoinase B